MCIRFSYRRSTTCCSRKVLQDRGRTDSQINTRIGLLEEDEEYKRQVQQLAALRQTAQETLEEAKRQMKRAKEKREERRREAALPNGAPMTPEEESA